MKIEDKGSLKEFYKLNFDNFSWVLNSWRQERLLLACCFFIHRYSIL